MFHKHKFNLKGNTLWCECGKIKHLSCNHRWKTISNEIIEIFGKEQRQRILVCVECGELKNVNTTTGQIN